MEMKRTEREADGDEERESESFNERRKGRNGRRIEG